MASTVVEHLKASHIAALPSEGFAVPQHFVSITISVTLGFMKLQHERYGGTVSILAASSLIIALAFGYYFAVFLPRHQTEELSAAQSQRELDATLRCKEYGMENYFHEFNSEVSITYVTQKFSFNPEMNTCLYYAHTLNDGHEKRTIVDMMKQRSVIEYSSFCFELAKERASQRCTSLDEFRSELERLMGLTI